jgi:DNA-binding NarL/FixJ family response regulator
MPQTFNDVTELVDATIRRVGRRIVLALPLGIGKPAAIANEFFRRALREADLDLTIITALSLQKPVAKSELEQRFAGPLVERIFGDCPDLEYLRAMRADRMPANVRVIEFFVEPGASLNVAHSQQNFLCLNYTHVAREIVARGVNVVAHLVARRTVAGELQISLGSNPDVTLALLPAIAAARAPSLNGALIELLSAREQDVLSAVASGQANKDIARALRISVATTRNHVQHILKKLDVHTKLEAMALVSRNGWSLPLPSSLQPSS